MDKGNWNNRYTQNVVSFARSTRTIGTNLGIRFVGAFKQSGDFARGMYIVLSDMANVVLRFTSR